MIEFETLGHYKEYFVGGKYIGTINHTIDEQTVIGYEGRKGEIIFDKLNLDNGRIIKAGTFVTTIVYPLCGKLKTN